MLRAGPILSNLIWIIASCMLLLAVFSNLNLDVFFTSDTLYLPCLYRDFMEQHSLGGWHLNPAPNFFPDMLVYFVLMACSGGSLLISSFVFAALQYFAILLLLRYLFKLVLPDAPAWWHHLACFILSFSLLETMFMTQDVYYAFYLVSNSFHTGAFTMGLAGLALTLRYVAVPHKRTAWLLFALIVLAVVSDKLFIVLYSVPALATFACLYKRTGVRTALRLICVNIAGICAGLFIFNNIDKQTGVHFDHPYKMFELAEIKNSFTVFVMQMQDYLSKPGFRLVSLYVFIAAFIAACLLCLRLLKRKEGLMITLFIFFFVAYSVAVWLAPILNGSYAGNDCIRYSIYPVYLSALCIPVMLAYTFRKKTFLQKPLAPFLAAGFSVILLCTAAYCTRRESLMAYFNYYPDMARKVDEIAVREHLHNGLGEYWQAKKISMFSRKGVKVRAVFEDLAIWDHVANERWFFGPGVSYDFLLLNDFRDTTRYQAYVDPLQTIREDGVIIVKTIPFKYDREAGGNLPVNTGNSE